MVLPVIKDVFKKYDFLYHVSVEGYNQLLLPLLLILVFSWALLLLYKTDTKLHIT
jgi:hypothetical protein